MIDSKKYMLTVFWNPDGFLRIDLLSDDDRFTSDYFISNILEKIYEATEPLREKKFSFILIMHVFLGRWSNIWTCAT